MTHKHLFDHDSGSLLTVAPATRDWRAWPEVNATYVTSLDYDMIQEFNVDLKAECDQLNLAHENTTNKASNYLVQ